jgi:hypothetical protein
MILRNAVWETWICITAMGVRRLGRLGLHARCYCCEFWRAQHVHNEGFAGVYACLSRCLAFLLILQLDLEMYNLAVRHLESEKPVLFERLCQSSTLMKMADRHNLVCDLWVCASKL